MSKRYSNEITETVDSMDRQTLYFTILILSILIGSSFYLSWSVDRGMGQVTVERLSIESAPGRSVEILVYSPRTGNITESMPVILTVHGLTGSKEGMYAFNVELARRNFTVVSIDLPGHGDSVEQFDITDFNMMAEDAYAAVRHIQTTFPDVDNESYGVLTHSLGFRVALELKDFAIAPMAYAAIGDVGKLAQDEFIEFPENLLFGVGTADEIVTQEDALQAIRTATGNASASAGITYGSLDNQTAYRLALGPSNHAFEVIDSTLVSEAVSWLVQGVQGESQLLHTRNPEEHVYHNKNTVTIVVSFVLLISVIPIMWLTYGFLPEKLRPRRIPLETQTNNYRRIYGISSILGAGVVGVFVITSFLGLNLEDTGVTWLSSMAETGFVLFLLLVPVGLLILMILILGLDDTKKTVAVVGVERSSTREHVFDILKNLIVAGVGIIWIVFWLQLADILQPSILLVLIKLPSGVRGIDTIILTILAIPFFLVDAAWIRGLLIRKDENRSGYKKTVLMLFKIFSKFLLVLFLTIILIVGTTAEGVSAPRVVLLGVIWVRILIVQVLAVAFTVWTSSEFENTWSATIMNAFILSLVIVTTLPLI